MRAAACLLLCAALQGWSQPAPYPGPKGPSTVPQSIYARAFTQFASADFFKPEDSKAPDIVFKLAPLLIHERLETAPSDTRFGAVTITNGVLTLDVTRPTIYFDSDTTQIHGQLFAQFSFAWCYPANAVTSGPGGPLQLQGVRITLNSAGQPVIWEALSDKSGYHLVFVARSVESAARERFGQPLPGRRFAVERGATEAPDTIVARVIEDGPMPMGPIVYLAAGSHSISTLLCRCMPSQAKDLKSTFSYRLTPLKTIPGTLSWPPSIPIEQRLRMPPKI